MNSSGEKTGSSMPKGVAKSVASSAKKMYQVKGGMKSSGSMSSASSKGMSKSPKGLAPSLASKATKMYKP